MRAAAVATCLAGVALVTTGAQSPIDAPVRAHLAQLFPSAASFSPKAGDPPLFTALAAGSSGAAPAVVGYAFWTTELEPLERGYDGPIKILVGMDTKGFLTGVVVAAHNEPYGDFSVDRPEFAAQFKGKNIRDPFRVGADIDAVSRATITITSAARAIRISARRMATQLLAPPK